MTRKRSRQAAVLDKCTTVTQCFHPISYSAASFLLFVDCAHVAGISRAYHATFWNYLLRIAQRYTWCKSHSIPVTIDSINWLTKYASVLQHQTLTWELPEESPIPSLNLTSTKLLMFYDLKKYEVPDGVESILLCNTVPVRRLPDHVKRVRCNKWSDVCHFMPNSLERLTIATTKLDFSGFPCLPHLTRLSLHQHKHVDARLSGIVSLIVLRKCVSLRVLTLYGGNVKQVTGLVVRKLVLRIPDLIDISALKTITCEKLDLSGCPLIVDFSAVSHIPLVKK